MSKTFEGCNEEIGAAMNSMCDALRRMHAVRDVMKIVMQRLPHGAPEEHEYLAAVKMLDNLTDALATAPHSYWELMTADIAAREPIGANAGAPASFGNYAKPPEDSRRNRLQPIQKVGPSQTGLVTVRVHGVG